MGAPFGHRLRVRYGECDAQGVVFNANYLAYMDHTMTELFRAAFGSYGAMVERGADMVVAEAQLRFLAPARFDDELDLDVAIEHLGNSSLVCRHTIRRDGELLIEGSTRHVFVDPQALTKLSIPDWGRDALAPWVVEPTPR
jgi:acyl-CoA thioester hydrolase